MDQAYEHLVCLHLLSTHFTLGSANPTWKEPKSMNSMRWGVHSAQRLKNLNRVFQDGAEHWTWKKPNCIFQKPVLLARSLSRDGNIKDCQATSSSWGSCSVSGQSFFSQLFSFLVKVPFTGSRCPVGVFSLCSPGIENTNAAGSLRLLSWMTPKALVPPAPLSLPSKESGQWGTFSGLF